MPTVFVGDPGNPNDPTTGLGQVDYGYYISTYEVTNARYAAFLNSVASSVDTNGLYNNLMGGKEFYNRTTEEYEIYVSITRSNVDGTYIYTAEPENQHKPPPGVSFWDAARFANWLTTGNIEQGVYDLVDWEGITPTNTTDPNSANFRTFGNSDVINSTDVGSYTLAASHYGTFDQGGNNYDWVEDITAPQTRRVRGGAFENNVVAMAATSPIDFGASNEGPIAIRLTSLGPIGDPATTHTVTFDLGSQGTFVGGLGLSQPVATDRPGDQGGAFLSLHGLGHSLRQRDIRSHGHGTTNSDGDDFKDIEEFTNATNPKDDTDFPMIAFSLDFAIELTVTTVPDRIYRVDYSNDSDTWQPLPEPELNGILGDGSTRTIWVSTKERNSGVEFYRVIDITNAGQ